MVFSPGYRTESSNLAQGVELNSRLPFLVLLPLCRQINSHLTHKLAQQTNARLTPGVARGVINPIAFGSDAERR